MAFADVDKIVCARCVETEPNLAADAPHLQCGAPPRARWHTDDVLQRRIGNVVPCKGSGDQFALAVAVGIRREVLPSTPAARAEMAANGIRQCCRGQLRV